MIRNEHLELNAGFADDPGTSAYEQMRGICHSKGVAVGRLNALFVLLDYRPNCMEAQAKGKYRDKQNKPLPGVDGDLARSCDEQLLDVFLAVKRIADERELLIERRDREREREESDNAYDLSTGDEAERHGGVEAEQQASDAAGDESDALSDGHMSVDDASALPESASGGADCDSGDQQGHVLPFSYDPILICMTPGCNRRRRRMFDRGYVSPRCREGALQLHCCRDCVKNSHCSPNGVKARRPPDPTSFPPVPHVETTTPNPPSLGDSTQPHHILRRTKRRSKRALVKWHRLNQSLPRQKVPTPRLPSPLRSHHPCRHELCRT